MLAASAIITDRWSEAPRRVFSVCTGVKKGARCDSAKRHAGDFNTLVTRRNDSASRKSGREENDQRCSSRSLM